MTLPTNLSMRLQLPETAVAARADVVEAVLAHPTLADVAEEFEISLRTLMRLIESDKELSDMIAAAREQKKPRHQSQ